MYHFKAAFVNETDMHKACRTVLITPEGEANIYGFSESELSPDKCVMIHTDKGNYNAEINIELGVYMDEEPIDWNLPNQN